MKLTAFEAQHLRRFTDGIRIDHFESGINVFHGPNGAGKSSIIRALRAAFFERYQTTTVTDLQPWDDPGAAPGVQVQFEHNEQKYELNKRFLKSPSALLVTEKQRLANAEADQALAELLGFSHPAKGLNTPSHLGVPGLLWIEQGEGQDIQKPAGFAQDYLRDALGQSIGDLTSSDADQILSTLVQERNSLLSTDKKRKPKGEYDKTLKALAELDQKIEQASDQAKRYQESVDQLAQVQAKLDKENRSKPWLAFDTQIQEKRRALDSLKTLQDKLARQQADEQRLQAQIGLHESTIKTTADRQENLALRAAQLATAEQASQDAVAAAKTAVQQRVLAQQNYEQVSRHVERLEQRQRRIRLVSQIKQLGETLTRSERQLAQAQTCEQQVADLTRQRGADPVTENVVREVRDLERKQQLLQAQLQASATRIHLSLKAGADPELNGKQVPKDSEHFITEATKLSLGDLGSIRITPGGQDAAELTASLKQVSARLSNLLSSAQAESGAALELLLVAAQRLSQDLTLAQQQLKILAPDGLAAQQSLCANQQDQLATLTAELSALDKIHKTEKAEHGVGDHTPEEAHALATDVSEAQVSESLAMAQEQLKRADQRVTQTDRDQINATVLHTSALQEHGALASIVAKPDFDAQAVIAREQIILDGQQLRAIGAELVALRAELTQAQPDALTLDIERLSRSAESARSSHADSLAQRRELQGRLDEASANGAGETLAGLEADRVRLQRKSDWFKRRAAALCLLTDKLEAARANATELLQAPLQKYINRYLNALMPGASMRLTDSLIPEQLVQGDLTNTGSFDAQSFGTREQLALLTRLAYADLLREAGKPTLIILDDGLVHTDDQRLGLMKRILYQAASRHQILIFTCHEDRWNDLGVTPRDVRTLEAAKTSPPLNISAA